MIPKSMRLRKKQEFKNVLDIGEKIVSPQMVVFGIRNSGSQKLGLIVSKKVGNAAERNLVKRRLRAIFHTQSDGTSIDVVVIARKQALTSSFSVLDSCFARCLIRLQRQLNHDASK